MATSIFFGGRLISVPGSYSVVDASGLETVGLSAAGIVAVLGEAEGGIPVSEIESIDDFIRVNKPEKAREYFRSGPLREVADMLFAPAKDPAIPGGAVQMVAMKVNPATQSTGSFSNAYGDALEVTSRDYGAFTSQINVAIESGTNQGKLVTITFEDEVETKDDIGGDAFFTISYDPASGGWDTMTSVVEAGGALVCAGTRAQAGLDSEIAGQLVAEATMEIVSENSADVGMSAIVYGISASAAAQSETLRLNGTNAVTGTLSFLRVFGVRIIGTTAGTVTLKVSPGGATILTVAAGTNSKKGMAACSTMYMGGGALTAVAGGASTKRMVVVGLSKTGAAQIEKLTLNGTTPVVGTATWSEIQFVAMGEVAAASTVTFSGEALRTVPAVQSTLQKVADYANGRNNGTNGFELTLLTGLTAFDPADLDNTDDAGGAVDCLDPAAPSYYANLWAIVDWINNNSQFVEAEIASGAAGGAPTNTNVPTYLGGGVEGMTQASDWQDALNWLKQAGVNTIVPLTPDPAVHAMVDAHCAYMCGIGRKERDAVVGIMNAGMTDVASKTEVKAQIVNLNSRHIRAVAQAVERYNTAGEREEFDPTYLAAIVAGMQAGSPIGESLTFKYANALKLRQAATWTPTDDAEEMIQAGLCFLESIDGVGRRVVRNVTTHLTTNNVAFCEASVNEAVNYAVYNLRSNLELVCGQKGFAGTVTAVKGAAVNTLGLLTDQLVIVAYRSLNVELVVDVMEVSVELAPVVPVNFVKTVVHLVTTRLSAE